MRAALIGADTRIADLAAALDMISVESLDVVLLHSDMADMTPPDFIRQMRGLTNVPLLVLADQGDEAEVVTALEAGADDYVRLPCDLTEIMIRIWALVRRAGLRAPTEEEEGPLRSGPLSLDPTTNEVSLADQRLPLTTMEFRILHFLLKNRGVVVPHQTMARALWSGRMDNSRLAQKYVQRVRGKLGDNPREPYWIRSVHGVGYQFIGPPNPRV